MVFFVSLACGEGLLPEKFGFDVGNDPVFLGSFRSVSGSTAWPNSAELTKGLALTLLRFGQEKLAAD